MSLREHELHHRLRVLRHHVGEHDQHHHQYVDLGPAWPTSEGSFKEADDVSRRQQPWEGQLRFPLYFLLESPESEEAQDGCEDVEAEDGGHHAGVAGGVEKGRAERKPDDAAYVPEETGDGNSEQKQRSVEITVNLCRSRLSPLNILGFLLLQ